MRIGQRLRSSWKRVEAHIARESSRRRIPTSMAAGTVLGLFPVLGTTTVLCLAVSLIFRLSLPVTQALNLLVYPLQLLLAVPFALTGQWLFDVFGLSLPAVFSGPAAGVSRPIIHAVFAWVLVSIPMAVVLRVLFRHLIHRPAVFRAHHRRHRR